MRYVDRTSVDEPESLSAPDGPGKTELQSARDHYSQPDAKTYSFGAYKKADIKTALERLFHGKCAYCESNYASVAAVDIEHYRPKGGVAEEKTHKGYWWLAADWKNLLPSCNDCNRRRYHLSFDQNAPELQPQDGEYEASGKQNSFPIRGRRARSEADDLEVEDALLIDPTRTDPALHLEWPQDTKLAVVNPAQQNNSPSEYGRTSIDVYGLNRHRLVELRTIFLIDLRADREAVLKAFDMALKYDDNEARQDFVNLGLNALRMLKTKCDPKRPYYALADAFFASTLVMLTSRYENLFPGGELAYDMAVEELPAAAS